VNLAGAAPFAVKGHAEAFESYRVVVITRANSEIRSMGDLRGRHWRGAG
jgi:phosphonate transport system substrate-binding protein